MPKSVLPDDFPWLEAVLAKNFGLSVHVLAQLRYANLLEDEDWVRVKNRVRYSTLAARKTGLDILGLTEVDLPWLAVVPVEPPTHVFKVYSVRVPNPFILLATSGNGPTGSPVLLRVRVKTKTNFRPGMDVRVKHVAADLYELVGHCPRTPGKY